MCTQAPLPESSTERQKPGAIPVIQRCPFLSFRGLRRQQATPALAVVGDGPLLGELRDLAQSLGIAELAWLPGGSSGHIP
jgi:hypothetical protein